LIDTADLLYGLFINSQGSFCQGRPSPIASSRSISISDQPTNVFRHHNTN